MLLMISYRGCW